MKRYLISCGGTGGHLAPGIALAEGLAARGHRATLLVSHKKIDARLLGKYPELEVARVPGAPFTFAPAGLARFCWEQTRGFFFSLRLVRTIRPAAIVGFGGFTTAAVIVAGAICGVPVALHEANHVPGRAIRLLGRLARRVYVPPGVTLSGVGAGALRHAGLPVRAEITRESRVTACAKLGFNPAGKVLVVLGGSQGAAPLNDWVRRELPGLAAAGVQVCCVTGPGKETTAAPELVGGQTVKSIFLSFSDDVGGLLSAADLVVSRAGAGTIAELIRCEAPAVLVPYPHAADNHQQANAAWFAAAGGGLTLNQYDLSNLSAMVHALLADGPRLEQLRANLAQLGRADPLDQILDDLESFNSSTVNAAPVRPKIA